MSGALTFNGKTAASLGLRIGGVTPYGSPGREVQSFYVPGRIGAVYPAKDYTSLPNEIREYAAALYKRAGSMETVERAMADIRDWLFNVDGYAELRDSYEPQFYRRAYFTGDFTPVRKGAGQNFEIPLRFSCDPRRFIVGNHDIQVSAAGSSATYITTPSIEGFEIRDPSRPLIYISTAGESVTISFSPVPDGVPYGQIILNGGGRARDFYFDAETYNAWVPEGSVYEAEATYPFGTNTANGEIADVLGDIRIGPGQTKISFNSSTVLLIITPRWWVR